MLRIFGANGLIKSLLVGAMALSLVACDDVTKWAKSTAALEAAQSVSSVSVLTFNVTGSVSGQTGTVNIFNNGAFMAEVPVGATTFSVTLPAKYAYSLTVVGPGGQTCALGATAITTLAASVTSTSTSITVTSAANLQPQQTIQIDNEQVLITSISGNALTVVRAQNATTAANHASAADVKHPTSLVTVAALGASVSGALARPVSNLTVTCVSTLRVMGTVSGLATGSQLLLKNNGVNSSSYLTASNVVNLTTLSQPVNAVITDTLINVNSTVGITIGAVIRVDNEQMLVTAIGTGNVTVTRAFNATVLASHASAAYVSTAYFTLFSPTSGAYNIEVATNPTGITCLVLNGAGTQTFTDIVSVVVSCVPVTYTIDAQVTWVSAPDANRTVGLSLNGGTAVTGKSTASVTTISMGTVNALSPYILTVASHPSGMVCTVLPPSTSSSASANAVIKVKCEPGNVPGTIGGSVVGLLSNESITLTLTEGSTPAGFAPEPLSIGGSVSGPATSLPFTFGNIVSPGGIYTVTVSTNLSATTNRACAITPSSAATGTINASKISVSDLLVVCAYTKTQVSGVVSGHSIGADTGVTGARLELWVDGVKVENNPVAPVSPAVSTSISSTGYLLDNASVFSFAGWYDVGKTFEVRVAEQPFNGTCTHATSCTSGMQANAPNVRYCSTYAPSSTLQPSLMDNVIVTCRSSLAEDNSLSINTNKHGIYQAYYNSASSTPSLIQTTVVDRLGGFSLPSSTAALPGGTAISRAGACTGSTNLCPNTPLGKIQAIAVSPNNGVLFALDKDNSRIYPFLVGMGSGNANTLGSLVSESTTVYPTGSTTNYTNCITGGNGSAGGCVVDYVSTGTGSGPYDLAFNPVQYFALTTSTVAYSSAIVSLNTAAVNNVAVYRSYTPGMAGGGAPGLAELTKLTATATVPTPRGVAFHPNGKYAYVVSPSSTAGVNGKVYMFNAVTSGASTALGLSTLNLANASTNYVDAGIDPYYIAVAPSGKFAYVSNGGTTGSISVYEICQQVISAGSTTACVPGTLSLLSTIPSSVAYPLTDLRQIRADDNYVYALSTTAGNGKITKFAIQANGSLVASSSQTTAASNPNPVGFVIRPQLGTLNSNTIVATASNPQFSYSGTTSGLFVIDSSSKSLLGFSNTGSVAPSPVACSLPAPGSFTASWVASAAGTTTSTTSITANTAMPTVGQVLSGAGVLQSGLTITGGNYPAYTLSAAVSITVQASTAVTSTTPGTVGTPCTYSADAAYVPVALGITN